MTLLDDRPRIKLKRNITRPETGVTGVFSRITDASEEVFEVVWPTLAVILGPIGRFLTSPIIIDGSEWNPTRQDAVYWGKTGDRRLRFSMTWSAIAQILFVLICTLGLQIPGCDEYLLPAGGGKNAVMAKKMQVQIKKIKKKKYIVNPDSPIRFEIPDIDKMVDEKVTKVLEQGAAHVYATGMLGSGTGSGAGYGAGHDKGQVRFIRLQYAGGDWNSNFGKGADNNMLLEYKVKSGQKTATESEKIDILHLNAYKKMRAPPMVYITGSGGMNISDKEVQAIRRYMTEQHGLLFADAASPGWGKNFKKLMERILPDVRPVPITLDDQIMRMPYTLPSVPFASPHDPPMVLTGWKIGGRWVAIYHPGDIGDCWKDGHSGVSQETASSAYELGLNIIHYAHSTYSEWVQSQTGGGKQ